MQKNWKTYKQFIDPRGALGVIDDREIPFKIKRVFWISNVPQGQSRGHHSHKECEQVIICLAGRFDVRLDNEQYLLSVANVMLYVPIGTEIILSNFSPDAVCLVLCSEYYDENEVQK
jgi:mannose-6-phosphate isomerase-like protein (cupin superfamily)